MDIVNQMMRMPMGSVSASLGMLTAMARELEKAMTQMGGMMPAAPISPVAGFPMPAGFPMTGSAMPPMAAPAGAWPLPGNITTTPDTDLNDDMVKLVQYKIVYTKPDRERVLTERAREEVVNYRTTAAQYGGLKIALWMRDHTADPRFRGLFADPKNLRYVKIFVQVLDRFPKERTEYDRKQTEAQEAMAAVLSGALGGAPAVTDW